MGNSLATRNEHYTIYNAIVTSGDSLGLHYDCLMTLKPAGD